jgi:DNA mismatch repair protein MutL
MAGRIHVLDDAVVNRIAAGEVVERPASVVKELVENSLDAGADAIEIDIEVGGKKLIRVRDNGCGMARDEAFLAVERHATSKLVTEKDLTGIATMGFRGEALASVAAVSRMRLVTYDGLEDEGFELLIEGGVFKKAGGIGAGKGTLIEVRNLFFNVPVRRKFLKSPQVEGGHVHDVVMKPALAFPHVSFLFREDDKVRIEAPPASDALDRIRRVYPRETAENLTPLDYAAGDLRIHGYVAKPPFARSSLRSVLTFVNGRAVRDRLINAAIVKAFSNLTERGRYPFAVLFIETPPADVDVNVHPQKTEVRFVDGEAVYNLVLNGVCQAVTGAPFHPVEGDRGVRAWASPGISSGGAALGHFGSGARPVNDTWEPVGNLDSAVASQSPPDSCPIVRQTEIKPPGVFTRMEIVGVAPRSFIVLHDGESLVILDHHAAHERIIFEDLRRGGAQAEGQDLLWPVVLELGRVEADCLESALPTLESRGFKIEKFGERDFVARGAPAWLADVNIKEWLLGLIDEIVETGIVTNRKVDEDRLLKTVACRAAVKETTTLTVEEIRRLLENLDRVGSIAVCPHGRPMTVRFSMEEIRRKMGRAGR